MTGSEPRPAQWLDPLLGDGLVAFELWGSGGSSRLRPEEAVGVLRASPRRRAEFGSGRACARAGIVALGGVDGPLPVGDGGQPRWPPGFAGSISHTDGYCVALVGREVGPARRGIGVDAERVGRVGAALWADVLTAAETEAVAALGPADRPRLASVVFSAKEAFYKAQFPLTGAWIGFHEVTIAAASGRLRIERNSGHPALDLVSWPVGGAWAERDGVVVAVVELQGAVGSATPTGGGAPAVGPCDEPGGTLSGDAPVGRTTEDP